MYHLESFCLSEGKKDIKRVQIMRAGKFEHPVYGAFELNEALFTKIIENFENKVVGIDLAIDYFHKKLGEAAGWVKELYLSDDAQELWAVVEWTDEGKGRVLDKRARYLSADFEMNFTDDKGKQHGATLKGAGLTNRPFIKHMSAILDEGELDGFDQIKSTVLDLTDDEKAQLVQALAKSLPKDFLAGVNKDSNPKTKKEDIKMSDTNEDAVKELAEVKAKNAELEKQNKELSESQEEIKQNAAFDIMLSEKTAVEAQRDSFMKGDVAEFAKLAKPLNLDESGHGEGGDEEANDKELSADEAQDKVLELAEAKVKEDDNLELSEAVSMVLSENDDLNSKYEGIE